APDFLLLQRNIEVEQFLPVGIAQAGKQYVRSNQRLLYSAHVKKKEPGLRVVRFHSFGFEHQVIDLFVGVLEQPFRFAPWNGNRQRHAGGASVLRFDRIRDGPLHILFSERFAFRFLRGRELNARVYQRERLVAVVADNQTHRQHAIIVKLHVKHRVLFGTVWIDSNGYVFILVCFVLRELGGVAGRRNLQRLVVESADCQGARKQQRP